MEKQIIQQIKSEQNSPVITDVTFWENDNYVNFSDTDSLTDYFHSYNLKTGTLLKDDYWKKKYNAVVYIDFGNNEMLPKYFKRLEKLQKATGYKLKIFEHKGIYRCQEFHNRCDIRPYCYNTFALYDASIVKSSEIKQK